MQFFTCSLNFLVKSFKNGQRQNIYIFHDTMQNCYPNATNNMVQLFEQQWVVCNDYIDKFKRLDKALCLPRKQFYNRLAGKDFVEPENAPAHQLWKVFMF